VIDVGEKIVRRVAIESEDRVLMTLVGDLTVS
jgi:hypothetical protein